MNGDDALENWRRAEQAAVAAEEQTRVSRQNRFPQLGNDLARAKALRRQANKLWSEFLGSSLAPLASTSMEGEQRPVVQQTGSAALQSKIDEWRRAQARASAAELKVVQAYSRYAQGVNNQAPRDGQAEAQLLRSESTARLDRVYEEAKRSALAHKGGHTPPP